MFSTEDELQAAIHDRPEIVLSGIPEINPQICPDAPGLVSLGREIPLSSGSVDNLFVDINAVLTFVECKRYSDARLKREVYPQAVNYASDIQNRLIHYNGEQFRQEFGSLIASARGGGYRCFADVVAALAGDPILEGKDIDEWQRQFLERFEYNVKSGVCRVVLLCAPAPNNAFNYRAVRNLMQLMSFSEYSASRYDIILMDLREERGEFVTKIIWRRYAALPQVPLVARSLRDTSAGIDRMKRREARLAPELRVMLKKLLEALSEQGLMAVENTVGYALKNQSSKKSIYTQISILDGSWVVVRHQIRPPESLYYKLEAEERPSVLNDLNPIITLKKSTLEPRRLFEIELSPDPSTNVNHLVEAITELGRVEESAV